MCDIDVLVVVVCNQHEKMIKKEMKHMEPEQNTKSTKRIYSIGIKKATRAISSHVLITYDSEVFICVQDK